MIVSIFALLTTAVLLMGIVAMAAGKKFSRKYSTKLMSLRVLFQAITLICLVIIYLISKNNT